MQKIQVGAGIKCTQEDWDLIFKPKEKKKTPDQLLLNLDKKQEKKTNEQEK